MNQHILSIPVKSTLQISDKCHFSFLPLMQDLFCYKIYFLLTLSKILCLKERSKIFMNA